MQRRRLLAAMGSMPLAALAGCGVDITIAEGPDAPSYRAAGGSPRLALVLAAGGPRGFAHVGVLKALDELRIAPDLVVGASVGSLIGAAYAAGLPVQRIETLALDFDFYRMLRWSPGDGWRMDGSDIATQVRQTVGLRRFEELRTPLAIVATDLASRTPAVFNQGDIGIAVQASCAIPGWFAPVRIRGRDVADGDIASPLPVRAARALGARRVIAVDVAVHVDKPRPPGAERYLDGDRIKREQIDAEARLADLVLHPYFGYWVNMGREFRVRTAQAAYEQTLAMADRLRTVAAA